jgi:hypothetical protein
MTVSTSAKVGITHLEEGQSGGEVLFNEGVNLLDALVLPAIEDKDLTAPPGGESNGQMWIVGSSATGAWAGEDNNLAIYVDGWYFVDAQEGMCVYVRDEDVFYLYDGSNWVQKPIRLTVEDSITASTTQSQGQGALTKEVNRVTTCANPNDTVTLPSAVTGMMCVIANQGASTLQIFPASGDAIQALGANNPTTLAAGSRLELYATSTSQWE